jgi:hypothetical protein
VRVQTGERNRLITVLDTAGIRLTGVTSDVFGVSGRAIFRALIKGEDTPGSTFYKDLDAGYLDRLNRTRAARHPVCRLAGVGFEVQPSEKAV